MIRYVELDDKKRWYELDQHLPEEVFAEKVRTNQGYVLVELLIFLMGGSK